MAELSGVKNSKDRSWLPAWDLLSCVAFAVALLAIFAFPVPLLYPAGIYLGALAALIAVVGFILKRSRSVNVAIFLLGVAIAVNSQWVFNAYMNASAR